jgi:aerobic carbon-monoxide dehydrogenase small subunit
MPPLTFTVNGRSVSQEVPPATLLVDLLRGPLALTGTHVGCDTAQCGACTVLLDGDAVKSCSVLAEQVRGRSVTTIEGLASPAGEAGWAGQAGQAKGALHVVQEAFMDCCLLSKTPAPTEAQIVQALEGNLCRCTGYTNIVAAVQQAARTLNAKQGAVA